MTSSTNHQLSSAVRRRLHQRQPPSTGRGDPRRRNGEAPGVRIKLEGVLTTPAPPTLYIARCHRTNRFVDRLSFISFFVNKMLDGGIPAAIRLNPPTYRALRAPVRVYGSRCKNRRRWRGFVSGCNQAGSDPQRLPRPSLSPLSSVKRTSNKKENSAARPHTKRTGRGRSATLPSLRAPESWCHGSPAPRFRRVLPSHQLSLTNGGGAAARIPYQVAALLFYF